MRKETYDKVTGGAVCGGQMEVLVEAWRPEPDFWDGS